jgi:phosphonate transport system permease protein
MTGVRTEWRDPAWRGRLTAAIVFASVLVPAFYLTEFNPAVLWSDAGASAVRQFLSTFLPPATSPEFLWMVVEAAWKTVAIATVGMAIAILIAFPAALVATRILSVSRLARGRMAAWPSVLRTAVRWLLIFLRSIPEIVWAMVFVRAVGLGDTAGVMAIGITYGGMLGKVYIEILESADQHATVSLLRNGSGRLSAFWYAALPVSVPELLSYTVYRWECAIRASVVMGFVGAGGLGQQMELSMKMLAGGEVLTMLSMFVLLIFAADVISAALRKVFA